MDRRIYSFLGIAFGLTWGIAGIGAALGVRADSGLPYMVLAATCMLMPAVAAIIQQRLLDKGSWAGLGLGFKRPHWRALVITALVGISIVPLCLAVLFVLGDLAGVAAFGHVSISNEHARTAIAGLMEAAGKGELADMAMQRVADIPAGLILVGGLLSAVFAACTVNLPFMLGEELGWRGYLYQRTVSWSGLKRVLFTGTVWGLWHAPLILMGHNFPEHPVLGVPLMVLFCTVLALLFDWSRFRADAVWGPCLLHGIINGSAGIFALFASGGHPLFASMTGGGGLLALTLIGLALITADKTYRRSLSDGVVIHP